MSEDTPTTGGHPMKTETRTRIADHLTAAADRLHALARRIDPPTYGVRIMWDDDDCTPRSEHGHDSDPDEWARIDSGEWVAVGMVAIERDHAGTVRETDVPAALWGIVSPSSELGACWPPLGGHDATQIWDLNELSGHLRTIADDLIAEARP